MKQIIVYTFHPSPADVRLLRQALGENHNWDSVLPLASALMDNDAEMERLIEMLRPLTASQHMAVFKQPPIEEIQPLTRAEAIDLIISSELWESFLRDFGVEASEIDFHTSEHPRCWIVAAAIKGGGIPPGVGFIVDKHSRRILSRRYIDLFSPEGPLL